MMKETRYIMHLMFRIFMLCAMMGFACPTIAQTSGDRFYSQGLELQKKQNVKSQKLAISKFQSARKLYDSTAKKKQCDDAIAVSNNIIKTLYSNREKGTGTNSITGELKASVLELSNEKLQLDCEGRSVTVNITTTESEWSVTSIANDDGMAFVSLNQHPEERSFEIVCSANTSTKRRSQTVEVRAGELKKILVVEQSGKPCVLSVEKTVVEFPSKGGSKSIEVYSNSDSVEEDNNNRNWKVVSMPNWVNVIGEECKEKGFLGKIGEKAKGLVVKKATNADDPSVKVSIMTLVVASKPKDNPSRSGEVVINSENQQATIIVQQK